MLPNVKECLYPGDPVEAATILKERGAMALIVAGGTTAARSADPKVSTLVDLTRMGFDAIELVNGGWSIGCNVRLQQLATHPGLKTLWNGMLTDAACSVGARPIRNAATVGGNAVALFRWSDPPVVWLAMNAAFDLVGEQKTRTLGADEFFARHPRQILDPAEILTRVRIQPPAGSHGGAFTKFSRTAFDLAVVDVAVCLRFEGQRCAGARVAVGATQTVPWRALEAEQTLEGRRLVQAVIADAAKAAREQTKTTDDVRTRREYRKRMVEVIVRRTIERAAACGQEKR